MLDIGLDIGFNVGLDIGFVVLAQNDTGNKHTAEAMPDPARSDPSHLGIGWHAQSKPGSVLNLPSIPLANLLFGHDVPPLSSCKQCTGQ